MISGTPRDRHNLEVPPSIVSPSLISSLLPPQLSQADNIFTMFPYLDSAVLKRLSSSMLRTAQRFPRPVSSPTTSTPAADLVLPPPGPIISQLVALGVGRDAAESVSSAFLRAASRLKSGCEADFRRRWKSLGTRRRYFQDDQSASLLSTAYTNIYTKQLNDWTTYLLEDVTPRVLRAQALRTTCLAGPSRNSQQRRPFNQNAIPVLEAFFAQNAFPSRLEKYELASKCDMEYRQIHVWFQNRRSRLRKEGKEPKRPVSAPTVLEELERTVIDTLLPPDATGEDASEEENQVTSCTEVCASDSLNAVRPPHAYPSPYPPLCPYDPFPGSPESRSLITPWPRQYRPTNAAHPSIEISDLAEAFDRMKLSESEPIGPTRLEGVAKVSSPCIGFATRCFRAPHPALIRTFDVATIVQRTANQERRIGDRWVSATNSSESQEPTLHATSPSPCRPKRRLPRRVPRYNPTHHSGAISHQPVARLPMRLSSSSSESDADSPLVTPLLLPTDLALDTADLPRIVLDHKDELSFNTSLSDELLHWNSR
ncbi:hypothetical protein C8Q70DRAFT_1029633 [Cubamyces menziesii]|uniref:Homeobox domain-containing protein n=1 Tax=Trametes cubensis TaxID=1111947 RepID=A0AAD7TYL0_9APHY|nr:hypothetical protein C8Q70DRAFT_1029633 [Cubamyces menziesii]KAJ8488473.1 hypothetical protein ONZ51_g3522 [Trametes cubensis]